MIQLYLLVRLFQNEMSKTQSFCFLTFWTLRTKFFDTKQSQNISFPFNCICFQFKAQEENLYDTILRHDYFSKIASTTTLMKCDYQGDGYCDDSNNNADCDFDDGDCCLNPVNTQFCNECWCYADNTSYVSGKITGQNFFWNEICY